MDIPEGYGTVFPYVVVDQAEKFITFLKNVFGAKEIGRTVTRTGRIANVRMNIGTSNFMISEAAEENMKAMPSSYYIYVEDVDATFKKALSNGATKWFEPANMPYEDRQAGIVDPFGNMWGISHRLVEESYD